MELINILTIWRNPHGIPNICGDSRNYNVKNWRPHLHESSLRYCSLGQICRWHIGHCTYWFKWNLASAPEQSKPQHTILLRERDALFLAFFGSLNKPEKRWFTIFYCVQETNLHRQAIGLPQSASSLSKEKCCLLTLQKSHGFMQLGKHLRWI